MDSMYSGDDSTLIAEINSCIRLLNRNDLQKLLQMLQRKTGMGQRKFERKHIPIPVDYRVGNRFYRDIAENISAGGAFIGTLKPFDPGQTVNMTFSDQMDSHHFKLDGQIVRAEEEGFAVAFSPKTVSQKEMLQRFVSGMPSND